MRRGRRFPGCRAGAAACFRGAGLLVLALSAALLLLPLPCADDLVVETGAPADPGAMERLASAPHEDAPAHGICACPCGCHVGIAAGPALARLPDPERGALRAPGSVVVPETVPSAITHPPLG